MRSAALIISGFLFVLAACGPKEPGPASVDARNAATATTRLAYTITGMHCNGCAEAIVAEVSEVKGVKSAACTFDSKCAVIELTDPNAKSQAEHAITKLGYTISVCEVPAESAPSK